MFWLTLIPFGKPLVLLGYHLWYWVAISLFAICNNGMGIPLGMLPYLVFYAAQTLHADSSVRALIGFQGTYSNAYFQLLLVCVGMGIVIRGLRKQLLLCIYIVSTAAIVQYLNPMWPILNPAGIWPDRAYAPIGNPVFLSQWLAVVGVFCLPGRRPLYWVVPILALILTKSRGAALAFMAGMIYSYWRPYLQRRRVLAVVLMGGVLAGVIAFSTFKVASDRGRVALFDVCSRAIKERPLMGWGLENAMTGIQKYRTPEFDLVYGVATQDHCHNFAMEALISGGVPGLLITILTSLWMISKSTPGRQRGAIIAYFILSLFNPIPLSVQFVMALILAPSMRDSWHLKISGRAIAALSLAAALFCLFTFSRVNDFGYPFNTRIRAAKLIGIIP